MVPAAEIAEDSVERYPFGMKSLLLFVTGLAPFAVIVPVSHGQTPHPGNRTAQVENDGRVLATEEEWKGVFNYWPMPFVEPTLVDARYRLMQVPQPLGLYRLSLDSQGNVTEIKILRRMGPPFDAVVLKALINWRAKAGPNRMVTIFLRYGQKHRVATATIREWGFAPGRL